MDKISTKQQIINELAKLYRLQDEGKNMSVLIAELEKKLFSKLDAELNQHPHIIGVPP